MHIPTRPPACWTDGNPSPRGQVTDGWPEGVKPGLRNPFFDSGRSCANARTPELWTATLRLTPLCRGCSRARRGLEIAAGITRVEE